MRLEQVLAEIPGQQWATVDLTPDGEGVHVVPCWERWHVLTTHCRCRPKVSEGEGLVIHHSIDERPVS